MVVGLGPELVSGGVRGWKSVFGDEIGGCLLRGHVCEEYELVGAKGTILAL